MKKVIRGQTNSQAGHYYINQYSACYRFARAEITAAGTARAGSPTNKQAINEPMKVA
jgi:hypothetical protein